MKSADEIVRELVACRGMLRAKADMSARIDRWTPADKDEFDRLSRELRTREPAAWRDAEAYVRHD